MQTLLLYIQLVEDLAEIRFANPMLPYLPANAVGLTCYDLDNFSDGLVIQYAQKLITQADSIVVGIEAKPQAKLQGVGNLLSRLADKQASVSLFYLGENESLIRLLSIFDYTVACENTYGFSEISRILDNIYPK